MAKDLEELLKELKAAEKEYEEKAIKYGIKEEKKKKEDQPCEISEQHQ